MQLRAPLTIRAVDTRYWVISAGRLTPPAPLKIMGGVTTPANYNRTMSATGTSITRQDGTYHGQRMLESEEEGEHDGHAVVEAKERRGLVRLLHEGKVGAEEKPIIVSSQEAIAGEKGLLDDIETVGNGAAGGPLGHNLGGDLILIHSVDDEESLRWESKRSRG